MITAPTRRRRKPGPPLPGGGGHDNRSCLVNDNGGDGVDYSGCFDTTMRFSTKKEAINFAKDVAISLRFTLGISSHKKEWQILLRCVRGERYRGNVNRVRVRKNTSTKRCGCQFMMWVEQVKKTGEWKLRIEEGATSMHNHAMIEYAQGHRQIGKLTSAGKKIVKDMSEAQAKPGAVLAAIGKQLPYDDTNIRQVYNHVAQLWKDGFEGRSVGQQFYHFAKEHNYVCHTQTDLNNVITSLFMAHPDSLNLFRNYYWYIGIDSTYKTNRYGMVLVEIIGVTPTNKNFLIAYAVVKHENEASYHWVLSMLKNLLGADQHPTVVVTDRELGLLKPIAQVFPYSQHLLCTWHINKDVENYVYKLYKDKPLAEKFTHGRWKTIIEAPTVEEYEKELQWMKEKYMRFKDLIVYVETTWLVHKEKFVYAWTNHVLHLGNTTTCRVESQHAALKKWLNTSTSALDTLSLKINHLINSQVSNIRMSLEQSRCKRNLMYSGEPFTYLTHNVSHRCLKLLNDEKTRMNNLSNDVHTRCGHVLRSTHQIPCACELKVALDTRKPVSVLDVHEFWRTLVIKESTDQTNFSGSQSTMSEDKMHFNSLVKQVNERDDSVARKLNLIMDPLLNPGHAGFQEPEVNTSVRGRPKGSRSTKRDPSAWEYRDKGRGRGRSSRGRNSSSRGRSSSGKRSNDNRYDPNLEDRTVLVIRPWIKGCVNVHADGNCGFRVIADCIAGNEDE